MRNVRIDDYIGMVVVVELDTAVTHEGVLELVDDPEITGYVKITSGAEFWVLPRHEIIDVRPVRGMGFKLK